MEKPLTSGLKVSFCPQPEQTPDAAIADAAFVRSCGDAHLGLQDLSPKQPLKSVNNSESQTEPSPHRV
jgi:hypothetical protein